MINNSRPVVVGVDGSPAALGAVRWAADEAVRLEQPLRIVHALDRTTPGDTMPVEIIPDEQALVLDAAVEARRWQPGLLVTTATWHDSPASALREQSRHATLVVVGSRGLGGLPALLQGSVGAGLAAHAYCPVLVVHHAERWAGPEAALPHDRPIVVGVDGSPSGAHALELAFGEAASRRVSLIAVRAWCPPDLRHRRGLAPSALELAMDRTLQIEVEPWLAKHPSVVVHHRIIAQPPATALLEAAANALMVVVGARGHGRFEEFRLGSVSRQVLQHADVPVLVARHV